jgi:hypothetical protein
MVKDQKCLEYLLVHAGMGSRILRRGATCRIQKVKDNKRKTEAKIVFHIIIII